MIHYKRLRRHEVVLTWLLAKLIRYRLCKLSPWYIRNHFHSPYLYILSSEVNWNFPSIHTLHYPLIGDTRGFKLLAYHFAKMKLSSKFFTIGFSFQSTSWMEIGCSSVQELPSLSEEQCIQAVFSSNISDCSCTLLSTKFNYICDWNVSTALTHIHEQSIIVNCFCVYWGSAFEGIKIY